LAPGYQIFIPLAIADSDEGSYTINVGTAGMVRARQTRARNFDNGHRRSAEWLTSSVGDKSRGVKFGGADQRERVKIEAVAYCTLDGEKSYRVYSTVE
jgi:hypothetical protein